MKKEIKEMAGEKTYLVIDQVANRFNFCGLVEIDEQLMQQIIEGREYKLTGRLPEDVSTAVETMIDNDCEIENFTGVVRVEKGDKTFYVLTW